MRLSLNIIKNYVAEPAIRDGKITLPDDRQCMRFMMLCKAGRLNPFQMDAFMIPFWNSQKNSYEWSMITAQSAFLKRAEVHPEYNGKQSGVIIQPSLQCPVCDGTGKLDKALCPNCKGKGEIDELEGDYVPETIGGEPVKLVGGWCRVYYKTKDKPEYQRLKLGTYMKNTKNWRDDPAGMICKCAEAAALRSAFPTTLGGLYLQEEMQTRLADENPDLRKPVFGQPAIMDAETVPEPPKKELPQATEPKTASDEEADMAGEAEQQFNPVKAVRALAKQAKIPEPRLLAYLKEVGCIEADCNSLEQVAIQFPDILTMVYNQWADMSAKMKGLASK